MKLTRIDVTNAIGCRRFIADLPGSVAIIAGPNGAGKTSLLQSIRLALTGEMPRVSLKKDAHQLVSDGAKTGTISIGWADGGFTGVALPDCKLIEGNHLDHPAAPFVTDMHRFSSLDDKERRSFLFALTGTKTSADDVQKRLLDRGADPKKIDAVLPLLRSGFPAAHKEAAGKATEAKGAWRAITGETYGAKKAEGWTAPNAPNAPDIPDGDGITKLRAEIDRLDADLEAESRALGAANHAREQAAQHEAKAAGWRQQAGQIERLTLKLEADTKSRDDIKATVEDARRHAQAKKSQPCPECGAALIVGSDGKIVHFVREPGDDTGAEAAERLAEYERSLTMAENAVKNTERDLDAAKAAQASLYELEQSRSPLPKEEDLEARRTLIADIKDRRTAVQKKIADAEAASRAQAEAERKTADAGRHHADVVAWDLIAAALAPDGIPGELLAQALDPINKLLAQSAADTGWLPVTIDADMAIRYGTRPIALCSESEVWRIDAMLTAAIAVLSGLKLALLDRFDVLDIPARRQAIDWFDTMAEAGEIHTLIVGATLKQAPTGLSNNFDAFWIEGGALQVQLAEAA